MVNGTGSRPEQTTGFLRRGINVTGTGKEIIATFVVNSGQISQAHGAAGPRHQPRRPALEPVLHRHPLFVTLINIGNQAPSQRPDMEIDPCLIVRRHQRDRPDPLVQRVGPGMSFG